MAHVKIASQPASQPAAPVKVFNGSDPYDLHKFHKEQFQENSVFEGLISEMIERLNIIFSILHF